MTLYQGIISRVHFQVVLTLLQHTPEQVSLGSLSSRTRRISMEVGLTFSSALPALLLFLLSLVPYNSLYVVGSVDESLSIRGFRYQPVDLEASVIRCHKNICGRYGMNVHVRIICQVHCIVLVINLFLIMTL